jgi:hypothetical protein
MDASTGNANLTFGVEIEFLLATLENRDIDPHENDPRQVYGITAPEVGSDGWTVYTTPGAGTARNRIADTLNSAGINTYRAVITGTRIEKWELKDDATIEEPNDLEPYGFVRVEIVSPPLYFSEQACQQVKAVIEVLTNSYRLITPESAGLHIHVGNESNGFDEFAIHKMLATLWTFEPAIETIHPPWRKDNLYSESFRDSIFGVDYSVANATSKERLDLFLTKSDWFDELWASFLEERGAYNFSNLDNHPPNPKNTIEFRQHESALDPDRVYHWTKLCVGLVNFAHKTSLATLKPFLLLHIDDPPADFTVVKVLTAIGLPPQSLFYSTKKPYVHIPGTPRGTPPAASS